MAGSHEMGLPRKELIEAEPSIMQVCLDFTPICLSLPHGLGGFPLTDTGTSVLSLVAKVQEIFYSLME
jgi:hypothetical protein